MGEKEEEEEEEKEKKKTKPRVRSAPDGSDKNPGIDKETRDRSAKSIQILMKEIRKKIRTVVCCPVIPRVTQNFCYRSCLKSVTKDQSQSTALG